MKKGNGAINIWRGALWITGLIILFLFAVIWYYVVAFDIEDKEVSGKDKKGAVYFEDHRSNDKVDTWESAIQPFPDNDAFISITGMTCACKIVNNNYYDVKNWTLRIDIVQECYLSGFWCGSVEIHQFRDGKEKTNFIENAQADVSSLDIDRYEKTETTMIHLEKGDYFVYYPSRQEKEDIVKRKEAVGIGFILYFIDDIDLSNWTLNYNNDLKIVDLLQFKIALILILFWLCGLILYFAYRSMSKRLQTQMNDNIRNISIMADLYLEAYLVDIADDTAQMIKGSNEKGIWKLSGDKVQSRINEVIDNNCHGMYRGEMKDFLELSTVVERMKGAASFSIEYNDESQGWCTVRLFNAGTVNGHEHIVFTVQDINEEKKKLSILEDRMSIAEYKQNVSGSFLETVSFAINNISSQVSADGNSIINMSEQAEVKGLAEHIVMNTRHMSLILNTMLDLYALEQKRLELHNHPYNVREALNEVYRILLPFANEKPYEFKFVIDEKIPENLVGDSDRIEQMLVIMLFSSLLMTQKGFVQFSLFGKQQGDEEEMVFSIRDSAKGFTEEELNEIHEFINGASIETFDNASLVYLKTINGILDKMGSELKIVSVQNEGTDFYFTIRQKIVE